MLQVQTILSVAQFSAEESCPKLKHASQRRTVAQSLGGRTGERISTQNHHLSFVNGKFNKRIVQGNVSSIGRMGSAYGYVSAPCVNALP